MLIVNIVPTCDRSMGLRLTHEYLVPYINYIIVTVTMFILNFIVAYVACIIYIMHVFDNYRSIGLFIKEENGALKFSEGNHVAVFYHVCIFISLWYVLNIIVCTYGISHENA